MPHVDDMNDAVLVGLAVEADAMAMYAVSRADMRALPPWERLPQAERANYCAMARAVRARYVALANADAPDAARWRAFLSMFTPEVQVEKVESIDYLIQTRASQPAASTPPPETA